MNWGSIRAALLAAMALCGAFATAAWVGADLSIGRSNDGKYIVVRYAGAQVSLVEMRLNGTSVATRKMNSNASTGETTFAIDGLELRDGDNTVEVRIFDAAGKVIETQTSTIKYATSVASPVKIGYPAAGATVNALVTIKLDLSERFANAYVSFFIDDEFKGLRNYPPYVYPWDTLGVPNGWHELQAWLVDEDNRTYKTSRIRVFVNNPAGRTHRPATTEPPVTSTNPPDAALGDPKGVRTGTEATGVGAGAAGALTPPAAMANTSIGANGQATGEAATTRPPDALHGIHTGPRILLPTGERNLVVLHDADFEETTEAVPVTAATAAVETPPATATVEIPPVTEATVVIETAPVVEVPTITVTPEPTNFSVEFGTRLPEIGEYTIYLDGEPVAFDVMPRVEAGVPLTPFRHLFEHAGGTVKWAHETKEVSAFGLGQDIWIKIGEKYARIDAANLLLERSAFIESGRTVVPLSFITDALGVDVQYDAESGHVLITRGK